MSVQAFRKPYTIWNRESIVFIVANMFGDKLPVKRSRKRPNWPGLIRTPSPHTALQHGTHTVGPTVMMSSPRRVKSRWTIVIFYLSLRPRGAGHELYAVLELFSAPHRIPYFWQCCIGQSISKAKQRESTIQQGITTSSIVCHTRYRSQQFLTYHHKFCRRSDNEPLFLTIQ